MTSQEREDLQRISRVMRAARKISGKNQVEIAKDLGISQSALSKFESAILIPSTSQWYKFCRTLNVDSLESFTLGTIDNRISATSTGSYPETTFKIPKKYAHHQGSKVRAIRPFLDFFSTQLGEEKLEHYLKDNKVDSDFFVVQDNQLNIGFTVDIATHLISTGSLAKKDVSALTRPVSQPAAHGALHGSYDSASGEIGLLQSLFENSKKYEINFTYKIESSTRKDLEISVIPGEHLAQFDYKSALLGDFLCRYKKSYFQQFSTYKGKKRVELEEHECHYKGAARCVYHFKVAG